MVRRGPEGAFGAGDTVPRVVPGLAAAERELELSLCALRDPGLTGQALCDALDRNLLALAERNAIRDGRP